jgi:hypothetical protein
MLLVASLMAALGNDSVKKLISNFYCAQQYFSMGDEIYTHC